MYNSDGQTRRILIVDDNRAIHDDYRKTLGNGDRSSGLADTRIDVQTRIFRVLQHVYEATVIGINHLVLHEVTATFRTRDRHRTATSHRRHDASSTREPECVSHPGQFRKTTFRRDETAE